MTKLILVSAAAFMVAAPAFADQPMKFERDGITYVGTIADHDGVRTISGHEVGSNRTFELRVAHGQVTGNYGGDYVSYPAPAPDRLASR